MTTHPRTHAHALLPGLQQASCRSARRAASNMPQQPTDVGQLAAGHDEAPRPLLLQLPDIHDTQQNR
jgi:hypothetical protein